MSTTGRKAKLVSMTELSTQIDKALQLAIKNGGAQIEKENLLFNWQILGRWLRLADAAEAEKLSNQLAAGLKAQGIEAEPLTVMFENKTFCGFVDKAGTQAPVRTL